MIYLDSAAVVKLVHAEPESPALRAWLEERAETGWISSVLTEIESFRAARTPPGPRTISRTVITAYGRDHAVASTLFHRPSAPGKVGRQMQTWVRFPEGWRVVAAMSASSTNRSKAGSAQCDRSGDRFFLRHERAPAAEA